MFYSDVGTLRNVLYKFSIPNTLSRSHLVSFGGINVTSVCVGVCICTCMHERTHSGACGTFFIFNDVIVAVFRD